MLTALVLALAAHAAASEAGALAPQLPFRPTLENLEEYARAPADELQPWFAVRARVRRKVLDLSELESAVKSGAPAVEAPYLTFLAKTRKGLAALSRAQALSYLVTARGMRRAAEARRDSYEKMSAAAKALGDIQKQEKGVYEQTMILKRLDALEPLLKAKLERLPGASARLGEDFVRHRGLPRDPP